jgi:hypothetical protein
MIRISHRLVYMALTMTYLAIYFGLEKTVAAGLVALLYFLLAVGRVS